MSVSVLVAAWNESERLGACIESILAAEWPNLEILVAAGGDDDTLEIARRHQSDVVHVLPQNRGEGKQAALGKLFDRARGDIIFLTDGDTFVPRRTFAAVINPILSGEAEVVTGNYRPHPDEVSAPLVFFQWSIDHQADRQRGPFGNGLCGANTALSKHALQLAGGFGDEVSTGTDYHLARRLIAAGVRIRNVDAAVETEYASDPRTFVRRHSRWLRNTLLHGWRFGDFHEVMRTLQAIALGTAFLAAPLTYPIVRKRGLALWLAALVGLSFTRLRYAQALSKDFGLPLTPSFIARLPLLTLLDVASWAMPLLDLTTREGRRRW